MQFPFHLPTTKTQEYTALMASIEEIQALMEAEVAGGSFLLSE